MQATIAIGMRCWSETASPTDERSPNAAEPVRAPEDLDRWVNMWVAVKDGKVITAAYNSHDLVRQVIEMGPNATGAVAQFVPKRTDAVVIGVG